MTGPPEDGPTKSGYEVGGPPVQSTVPTGELPRRCCRASTARGRCDHGYPRRRVLRMPKRPTRRGSVLAGPPQSLAVAQADPITCHGSKEECRSATNIEPVRVDLISENRYWGISGTLRELHFIESHHPRTLRHVELFEPTGAANNASCICQNLSCACARSAAMAAVTA
jgi:hypothetical protein